VNVRSLLELNRKDLIINTARRVIYQNGLFDASIGKIAKEANIPVGSIYTYFKSKEELINEIYSQVKHEIGAYAFQPIPNGLDVKSELGIYWTRFVSFGIDQQEKFFFAEQFINSPLISTSTRQEIRPQFERLFQLIEIGKDLGLLKPMCMYQLQNMVHANIVGTIKFLVAQELTFTEELSQSFYQCCWDTIANHQSSNS